MNFLEIVGLLTLTALGVSAVWFVGGIVWHFTCAFIAIRKVRAIHLRHGVDNKRLKLREWFRAIWNLNGSDLQVGGVIVRFDPSKPLGRVRYPF